MYSPSIYFFFFFFNDTATTEIYTLSLHDALPIYLMWVPIPFERSFRMAYSRTHYGTGYYIFHQYVKGAKLSQPIRDRKSTRLNSSHLVISYAVFCLKKKKTYRTLDNTITIQY